MNSNLIHIVDVFVEEMSTHLCNLNNFGMSRESY